MSARPAKYGNRKTLVDGVTFASAREAKRYGELKLLQRAGEISELSLQPKFELGINGVKVCAYHADFSYKCKGLVVVEDSKGFETQVFKLKRKLMKAVHGIEVVIT